jgi:hypothetical protein
VFGSTASVCSSNHLQLGIKGESHHEIARKTARAVDVTENCNVFLHIGSFTAGGVTITQRGKGHPVQGETCITLQPWTAVIITNL